MVRILSITPFRFSLREWHFSCPLLNSVKQKGLRGWAGVMKDTVKSPNMLRPTDNCTNLAKCSLFSASSVRNNFRTDKHFICSNARTHYRRLPLKQNGNYTWNPVNLSHVKRPFTDVTSGRTERQGQDNRRTYVTKVERICVLSRLYQKLTEVWVTCTTYWNTGYYHRPQWALVQVSLLVDERFARPCRLTRLNNDEKSTGLTVMWSRWQIEVSSVTEIQQNVDYPNVNHPKRQISEPTFSSFYLQTTTNQRLLHAIKFCVISIKYCILYVLYCIVMVTLS